VSQDDKYTYPNSGGVLRNKLGIGPTSRTPQALPRLRLKADAVSLVYEAVGPAVGSSASTAADALTTVNLDVAGKLTVNGTSTISGKVAAGCLADSGGVTIG
jgi:hypothetical protein